MTEVTKTDGTVRQGLDIQKYRAFRNIAAKNPEDVIFGLEASGIAEGRAVHTHAKTGAYTLGGQRIDRIARQHSYHFGAHREVEEALGFINPTDREQETEVALAALAGCINAVITVSAAERGIDLANLRTDIAVSWDPAVFLHLRDTEQDGKPLDQFGDLKVTLNVSGDGLNVDDIDFIRREVQAVRSKPTHENQNDENDQDDADDTNAAMTEPVAIAAEAAAKATQQENDKNDDEYKSDRHDLSPVVA